MIQLGMELTLELDREDRNEKFSAQIADFTDERIYITYPVGKNSNRPVFLLKGERLFASFTDKETGCAYLFRTKVTGQIKNNIPLLILDHPEEDQFLRIQRREFVRVKTAIDASLKLDDAFHPTITADLSAGGCSIVNPNLQVKQGDLGIILLVISITSKDYLYLTIQCRVVRCFEKNGVSLISLQFLNLTNQEQQQLIRYTFEKQLEYRKKGIEERI